MLVATSDLKKIKRLSQDGGATIHGDNKFSINEIVKLTYKTIKGAGDSTDPMTSSRGEAEFSNDFGKAADIATMKRM